MGGSVPPVGLGCGRWAAPLFYGDVNDGLGQVPVDRAGREDRVEREQERLDVDLVLGEILCLAIGRRHLLEELAEAGDVDIAATGPTGSVGKLLVCLIRGKRCRRRRIEDRLDE